MGHSKPGKPKSKRVPVRLRHKIEKASAAKQRKARKEAKKNPEWRSKLKKDPGIPNLFPYKDKILSEIEERRRLKAEELDRKREEAREAKKEKKQKEKSGEQLDKEYEARMEGVEEEDILDDEEFEGMDEDSNDDDDANPMAALLASARARAAEYEQEHGSDDSMDEYGSSDDDDDSQSHAFSDLRSDGSQKAFNKIFKAVIDAADVILYVLDARDPEGTRSQSVEREVLAAASGGKRLIFILNKIDLVPPKVLHSWLVYLRRYFPTLPLRASGPAPNAQTFNHKQLTVQSTSAALFKALKTYSASKGLKRAISVGVIGYPNVGKSSVINALLSRLGGRGTACPVGAEAGVTTALREVKIDSKLKLLDSPGIVLPSDASSASNGTTKQSKIEHQAHLILLNAIPPKQISDPIPAVTLLLKRLGANPDLLTKLMGVYGLPPLLTTDGDPTTDFLVQVARKRGRLGKGGVPNLISAAMTVVTDWRDGRIQGWLEPPSDAKGDGKEEDKQIVTEWAEEFKIEGLWGDDENAEEQEGEQMQE